MSGVPLHVLVIDDSAVVRQALRQVLASEPGLSVSVAGDPMIAEKKIRARRPDVVILDLELPVMDGMTWLRHRMATDPIPVIVCSARAGAAAGETIRALEEGAVEVVPKPRLGVRDFLVESRDPLIRAVRAAADARLDPRGLRGEAPRSARALEELGRSRGPDPARQIDVDRARTPGGSGELPESRVIAIGASTGGPQALQALLGTLPPDSPGIVIVQHMSGAFTPAFARRLDELSALSVRQAEPGDRVEPGTVLVAPGGVHVELRAASGRTGYELAHQERPPVHGHRPSADVLLASVARVAGASALGVLLTGMGCDGASGLLELRRSGGATVVESRESCVVFGMPRSALELGAAEDCCPLWDLPAYLERWIRRADEAKRERAR